MARADLLNVLYSKEKSPLEFQFDSLWAPSLYNFLTVEDINQLHSIATSLRYSSKIEAKYKAIDEIMKRRGCKKFHCGTNRIVYSIYDYPNLLIKIALDRVGMDDNPSEYKNQFLLKPFVTKVFEISPCGTVALVERVQPITSREEFLSVGPDVYELLTKCIIGKYVLEDIGSKFFMNYGLRNGFGVVLLDYPYVFELDGNKLYCNRTDPITGVCGGLIDYDEGFNYLVCTKCGKKYLATELKSEIKANKIQVIKSEEDSELEVSIVRGDEILLETQNETDHIIRK